jgi:hypothetical protein
MKKKKLKNVQNENDNDTDVNYETFAIDKNSSNQQYIIHNFRVDYQQKSIHFNSLCRYEFSSKINKINNLCCHRFNNEHPHKKMTLKIMPEQFVFHLHHGIQFLTSN